MLGIDQGEYSFDRWQNHSNGPSCWIWSSVASGLFGPDACPGLGRRQWVVPRMYWQEQSRSSRRRRRDEYTVSTLHNAAYRIYIGKLQRKYIPRMIPQTVPSRYLHSSRSHPNGNRSANLTLRGEYSTVTCEPHPRMGAKWHRSQLRTVAACCPDPEQSQGLQRRWLICPSAICPI